MSVGPLTHSEITAWSDGMKLNIIPLERDALVRIDDAFLAHCSSKDKKKDAK